MGGRRFGENSSLLHASRTLPRQLSGSDLFKQNADDCRQRSVEAGTAYEKADWFELAEEWQKLANAIDGINAQPQDPPN